jgi:ribosomal protein S19E (S16A)
MLLDATLEVATPAEVVALARLAQSPDIIPPPHLRSDLEAKGWVDKTEAGDYVLTSEGRTFVEQFD